MTYLKQLEAALRQKYPEPQVRDILSDYEDFFNSGTAEGKSEAELCEDFGPPEQAARELATDGPRHDSKPFAVVCSILAIAFIIIFWVFHGVFYGPQMPLPSAVGFWLALLFPLALEGVLAVWFARNGSAKAGMKWLPAVQAVLAVPVTAALVWLIHYTKNASSFFYGNLQETGTLVASVTATLTDAACLILLASIVLFVLYAIYGHKRAHWFLFLDATLLTLILNFISFLSRIDPENYDGAKGIASCVLWAVLPNLAAAGVYWIVLRIASSLKLRRAKAWTGR